MVSPIHKSSTEDLSEIDELLDQIHVLVDRLVDRATDGQTNSIEEIQVIRDDDRLLIKGDLPDGFDREEISGSDGSLPGGVLIELPFDNRRSGRIVT